MLHLFFLFSVLDIVHMTEYMQHLAKAVFTVNESSCSTCMLNQEPKTKCFVFPLSENMSDTHYVYMDTNNWNKSLIRPIPEEILL